MSSKRFWYTVAHPYGWEQGWCFASDAEGGRDQALAYFKRHRPTWKGPVNVWLQFCPNEPKAPAEYSSFEAEVA